jgi:hypothetical protein
MSSFTWSEESTPQLGQMNRTGLAALAGVTSNEYLAPQEHWIFMPDSGLWV